jgi:hypothetical protein
MRNRNPEAQVSRYPSCRAQALHAEPATLPQLAGGLILLLLIAGCLLLAASPARGGHNEIGHDEIGAEPMGQNGALLPPATERISA